MDDPDDPVVAEKDVPAFNFLAARIREIDNTIIIFRVYYFFRTRIYRFQLLKKNRMCIIEIHRDLLESIGKNGTSSERKLEEILDLNIEDPECWNEFEG